MPALDGLRGLAIVFVLVQHCQGAACYFARSVHNACTVSAPVAFFGAGHTGVSLFFVLSAFLLSFPLFEQAMRGEVVSLRQFYRRRALRILPLYWGVLLAGLFVAPSTEALLRTLPFAVFLNGFWQFPFPGTQAHVSWSLATEVQFYALLPLPFLLGRRVAVPLAVALVAVYSLLVAGAFGSYSLLVGRSVVGRSPLFLSGVAAAWVYVRYRGRLRAWRPFAVAGDLVLVACFVALELLLRPIMRGGFPAWEMPPYVTWHVVEGVLWGLVVLLVASVPLRLRALLTNRALMWLGAMSYSIYLLHLPVLLWAGRLINSPLVIATGGSVLPSMLALAAVSVAFAPLTYRFVEQPFLRRKVRVERSPRPGAEPSIARAA